MAATGATGLPVWFLVSTSSKQRRLVLITDNSHALVSSHLSKDAHPGMLLLQANCLAAEAPAMSTALSVRDKYTFLRSYISYTRSHGRMYICCSCLWCCCCCGVSPESYLQDEDHFYCPADGTRTWCSTCFSSAGERLCLLSIRASPQEDSQNGRKGSR